MSGHRDCFYCVLDGKSIDEASDDYSLGLHLVHEHGVVDREDFNNLLSLYVVEKCSPAHLEKKEHLYIHKFKTLTPFGLNKVNPFELPLLLTLYFVLACRSHRSPTRLVLPRRLHALLVVVRWARSELLYT